ncbi:patatin-like phospholipase family protein [Pedobacter gandavensis]|uniref:patatin-like phospholipase family protein n=1 Tax=Pedobacter gandavensis TaxID=2679963 RepID=UPI00292FBE8F|nr:patatin-like phospholipase family protein [Pedobacter gandavensis]
MAEEQIPLLNLTHPLASLGITFSGGGFRAAAFSLGTLSYLDAIQYKEKKLVDNITFMSSASGGSITSLFYSAKRHLGISFNQIFNDLIKEMEGECLLDKMLKVLADDSVWETSGISKQRNIINAFSIVYDRVLFTGETFSVYSKKSHMANFEICINSTEFFRGLSFRFQTDGTPIKTKIIGNKYIFFNKLGLATFNQIKLSDALAASSCFPIGLEPIVYPRDFSYKLFTGTELTVEKLIEAISYKDYQHLSHTLDKCVNPPNEGAESLPSFGLMDGGMTDNQGLSSIMLADVKRRKRSKPTPFDLIIVTDVSSYFMDAYLPPHLENSPSWRTKNLDFYLNTGKLYLVFFAFIPEILLCLGAMLLLNVMIFGANIFTWVSSALGFALILVAIGLKFLKRSAAPFLKNMESITTRSMLDFFNSNKSLSDPLFEKIANYLSRTNLGVIEQMIKARVSSVITMVSDVNLKQVRRLIYESFYKDKCWENRRMPNFIYELSSYNAESRSKRIKSRIKGWVSTEKDNRLLLEGLDQLQNVAEDARLMGTTLWFDQKDVESDMLKKIIATGQFTTCMNLLEYVLSLKRKNVDFSENENQSLELLRRQLENDLLQFKADPYFLYNKSIGKDNQMI